MSAAVDAIVAAFNRRDLDAFVAGYGEDVAIEDGRGTVLVRGRDELAVRYGAMFAAHPELRCEVLNRFVVGDYVVDEERVTGRAQEPERLVVVYRLDAGRVAHERILS